MRNLTDISVDIFAKWRVIPEDVVTLSLSAFWYGGAAWSNDALSDERDDNHLLMPAGMFFVVIGGWLLSQKLLCYGRGIFFVEYPVLNFSITDYCRVLNITK